MLNYQRVFGIHQISQNSSPAIDHGPAVFVADWDHFPSFMFVEDLPTSPPVIKSVWLGNPRTKMEVCSWEHHLISTGFPLRCVIAAGNCWCYLDVHPS